MKQVKNLQFLSVGSFLMIILTTLLFGACKKDDETEKGTLYFHLHTNLDTNEVDDYRTVYSDGNGHRAYLSLAQLYISGIKAIKSDGSTVSLGDVVLLKTKDVEQYLVGKLPAGTYTSVSFHVGLDATTNQTLPSSYASSSPLASTDMWFGSSTQGYIFVNVQGGVDTTTAQTADVADFRTFSFQLGTAAELQTVTMPSQTFTVSPNEGQEVHITIDYAKLLDGLDLKTEHTAAPFSNASVAAKVTSNVPLMFRYEE